MDLRIEGKCALVFGAGGGLGGAIARVLGTEGAKVIAADIVFASAQETATAIAAAGGTAEAMEWDIGDVGVATARLDAVREKFGDVEILINNTGGPPPSTATDVDPGTWIEYFQSMVVGVIHITDLALPAMRSRSWGRIITSTSSGVVAPIPNLAVSNALRMSLVGWSKSLAREVGSAGITANIVLPGRIATRRIEQLDEARAERESISVDQVRQTSSSAIPLGRYGQPIEYGQVVAFLASEAASYMTGSIVRVDGGLIASI